MVKLKQTGMIKNTALTGICRLNALMNKGNVFCGPVLAVHHLSTYLRATCSL